MAEFLVWVIGLPLAFPLLTFAFDSVGDSPLMLVASILIGGPLIATAWLVRYAPPTTAIGVRITRGTLTVFEEFERGGGESSVETMERNRVTVPLQDVQLSIDGHTLQLSAGDVRWSSTVAVSGDRARLGELVAEVEALQRRHGDSDDVPAALREMKATEKSRQPTRT